MVFSESRFSALPVVGIMRNMDRTDVLAVLPLYIGAGFTTVEITLNSGDALATLREAVKQFGDVLQIGAGTVLNVHDMEQAYEAGARFMVTPVVCEAVINKCVAAGIPVFPGAFSPTEIVKAWDLGACMVKVFPAASLGTAYFKNILAPLSHIRLLATGGVDRHNMKAFLEAGASGLGIGNSLFDKTYIGNKDWPGLGLHFKNVAHEVKACLNRT